MHYKTNSNIKLALRNSKGFALMELVVYMGVFVIFMYVTTSIFTSVLDVQVESDTTSVVQQDSRFILERLSYDIHRADSIVTPSTAGATNSILQLSISGETYTYSLSGQNLEITNDSGTYRLNSAGSLIENLSFERVGNSGGKHSVIIDFTNNSEALRNGQPEQVDIHTAVGLR